MALRPRQSDIAKMAGVSQTTVSLTLNGKTVEYGINSETEERIMSAARELGYVPNVTARALRGGRNRLIGVHAYEPLFPTSRESYYEEILVGIEQGSIRAGHDLVLFTSMHQQKGPASIFDEGRNRLRIADGALIIGFHQHDEELVRLAEEGFPFVFIGRREKPAALGPYVTAAYVEGVRDVTRHVFELGHRKVAYLGLDDRVEPRVERRRGFQEAVAETGLDVVHDAQLATKTIDEVWLRGLVDSGATALLVESTAQLEVIGALCDRAGLDVPGQISIVGLDSMIDPAVASHPWTHLHVPRREMGMRAVDLLLESLAGLHERTVHERLPCEFVAGSTLLPLT
ncbi:LacI family DNA-binding transcriptional regulator [Ruania alba]|uniref:DNA-binding transcriptional regulator, LacI/PurR family n=1 Tax=Ruania alba TaxID=648782 RepID=A0A1H5DB52_9MICO|nr:LacI family DNA-binding transcriptional regulator [Ruania alba]SED76059.1 DNA-binding transcriptional regulator, LacI/PurR family [Ruania alba]